MTKSYRTKAIAVKNDSISSCPDKLAVPTYSEYEHSISLHHEVSDFYSEYRNYYHQNEERLRSTKEFYDSLEKAGFKREKMQSSYMAVLGVKLRD